MFRYIQQYAEKMQDANVFPVVSLFIFMIFFIVLLVFVKKMGKDKVIELSNIPFDKDEPANSNL